MAIVLLTSIINLLIGSAVFYNNRKSASNILLALLCFINVLWTIFTYLALFSLEAETRLFWVRTVMVATSPYGPVIYLLASVFPGQEFKVKQSVLMIVSALSVSSALVSITPAMFSRLENLPGGNFNLVPGAGVLLYGVTLLVFMVWGFWKIVLRFKKSRGLLRKQIGYFLLGLVVTFTLGAITNFGAVVVFNTIRYAYLGPPLTLIFVGLVSWAIVKHKLFDVRFIVGRAVSYTLLLVVVIMGYTLALFALTEALPADINRVVAFTIPTLVVAFTFSSLRRFLEKITDRIFFKGKYDTEALLLSLTHVMIQEIDIEKLCQRLLDELLVQVRITRGAFLVLENRRIKSIESRGFSDAQAQKSNDDVWNQLLEKDRELYIFDDLTEGQVKDLFRKLEIALAFVLRVQEEPVAILILGHKMSGDMYEEQDLDLLQIFASQAGVALQNAVSYREIYELSKTLEKKVENRTKKLKEAQEKELSKARQLLKMKDEFVFVATHDLKAPVAAIGGYIDLLKKSKSKFSIDAKRRFEAIVEANGRLNQLINDLLQVARSDSGIIKVVPSPVNVPDLISEGVKILKPALDKRCLKINFDFDRKHKIAMADSEKFEEVFENLLSNSVKYNREKGSVTISTKAEKGFLKVSILDTGFGIPKKQQSQLFQKFFRAHQPGTENVSGTGLGLFIVRMLVEKMRGRISFVSEENKGSTFTFTLPLA